jgi:hypothetical protein
MFDTSFLSVVYFGSCWLVFTNIVLRKIALNCSILMGINTNIDGPLDLSIIAKY